MKKIIFLLLGVIVISNAIWIYIYVDSFDKPPDTVIQVYNLDGTGEIWDVMHYNIIVTSSKILRGHAKLVYKGDPKNIEDSTYYKVEIQEINPNGHYETVYADEANSIGGPVSILSNLNDIGSITSDYSFDEIKKVKQNYESSTLTITWNDNNGELRSETINLDIVSESIINDG